MREAVIVKIHQTRDSTGLICPLLARRRVLRGQPPEVLPLGAGAQ